MEPARWYREDLSRYKMSSVESTGKVHGFYIMGS